MIKADERMIKGLRKAMEIEVNGRNFYTMAADGAVDPKGKEAFRILADEELRHLDFLRTHYRSAMEFGSIDTALTLGTRHDFQAGPIFSDEIAGRLKNAQFEMSALSIGMQLELSSMDFYKKQASEVSDPYVKRFYEELVKWEKGHYDALSRQQEMLKEDFWATGGFAPF